MKINITPTTAIRLTINETVVANKGCPKATPNLALVPACNGTAKPAARLRAKAVTTFIRQVPLFFSVTQPDAH
ncbi:MULTISPECIES: hypothetical protein [Pseudomonas syringae group]|uniref:hypothetical protein n=1 Tax=Pseudomonas syringae group TaxID=136849 RepID=UPI001F144140|nr:hypothetical protein [Pseudomonas viridiflava]